MKDMNRNPNPLNYFFLTNESIKLLSTHLFDQVVSPLDHI